MRLALLLLVACGGSTMTVRDAPTPPPADTGTPKKLIAYVSGYGPDLAWLTVDPATGALAPAGSLAAVQASPSFLAIDAGVTALYAVSEANDRVVAYSIDGEGALHYIDDVSSGGHGPAHISIDRTGKWVLVANYTDGTVSVLPMRADRGVGDPQQTLAPGANAHMILTDASNRYAFVPCLGSDLVAQYTFDAQAGKLTANGTLATAAGAGPRHLAFAPDGVHAYLLNEKSSTIMALALDGATGKLSALQTLSTLPAGSMVTNTGAEVWVHPSGKLVFASNRGDDSIATFAVQGDGTLALVGHTKTGGQTPRDFTLDPSGKYIYVANQGSNNVVQLAIDVSGTLTPVGQPLTAQMPSFVGVVALP